MTRQYRAEQVVAISGWECGTEIELTMVVTFTVHPYQPATEIDPPEEASAEVVRIRWFHGKDELTLPWSIGDRFASEDGFKEWLLAEATDQIVAAEEDAADAKREMRGEA